MKHRYYLWIAMLIMFGMSLSSCGGSQKPDMVDHSLYTESMIVRSGKPDIINAPGMVMFMSQGALNINGKKMGARLAYLNKKNHNSAIFCFDNLCEHANDCIANTFHMASLIVYNTESSLLYTVKPEMKLGGAGSALYKLDLQAGEAICVFEGNGNEIKYLKSKEQYIYMLRQLTSGGYEVIRHNTASGKSEDMILPNNKKAVELIISGDTFYVLFADEIFYYKTDKDFSSFTKCDYFTTSHQWKYILGEYAYIPCADNIDLYATQNFSELKELNIQTGETKTVFKRDNGYFKLLGLDDNMNMYYTTTDANMQICYFNLNNLSTGIICDLKDEEVDCINEVYVYDSEIYVHCHFTDSKTTIIYLDTNDSGLKVPIKADPSAS